MCRALAPGMSPTGLMIMRELVAGLERNYKFLRAYVRHGSERERLDSLAKLAIHRATCTIDLYEEEPLPERAAIGAMYGACDVALKLLHALEQVPSCEANQQRLAWTLRDIRQLISELFEWVIAPVGEPILSVE